MPRNPNDKIQSEIFSARKVPVETSRNMGNLPLLDSAIQKNKG